MIVRNFKLALVALLATGLDACPRARRTHSKGIYKRQMTSRAPLSADETFIINSFDNNSISDWSYYYTHRYHVAGFNNEEAQWTADRWSEAGITTRLDKYNVYLDYPMNKSLVVTWSNGSTWTPMLEEAILEEDPTTGYRNRVPTFHGYSASGQASAEYVYVGRGQKVDYDRLGIRLHSST